MDAWQRGYRDGSADLVTIGQAPKFPGPPEMTAHERIQYELGYAKGRHDRMFEMGTAGLAKEMSEAN